MHLLSFTAALAYTVASVGAQSALMPEHSNTCLKRSVIAYTSESTTYLYLGTSSFSATPSYCANVTTETLLSTVYGANVTVTTTITPQPTAVPPIPPETIVADYGFEAGGEPPFDGSASGPAVTAEIATAGPMSPYSGDNYLLITFHNTSTAQRQGRRQVSPPPVYNVTQTFAATLGQSFTLRAYAAQAANSNVDPDCALTICAQGECGQPIALTGTYSLYSSRWTAASTEATAAAMYSVQCNGVAYVALDNITVVASRSSLSSPSNTVTQYVTRTFTLRQTVLPSGFPENQPATTTITQLVTTSISGSAVVFTSYLPTFQWSTATAQELVAETKTLNFTTTERTVSWVTATAIEQVADTKLLNQTLAFISTKTTTITRTLDGSAIPAITATETTTQWITATSLSGYPVLQNASTTTILSTQFLITTEPAVTLPQATYTPLPETQYITVTLEPSTITSYISVTPPPLKEYATYTETLAVETLRLTETLPQVTEMPAALTQTLVQTFTPDPFTRTQNVTYTLPQSTTTVRETYTLPQPTTTLRETYTLPQPTSTRRETYTLPQSTTTLRETFTRPASTIFGTITETTTRVAPSSSQQESSFSVPSGVPAVVLASPTAIVGSLSGSPRSYDDFAFPIELPFALTLFDQPSSQVYVTTNGLVGWNSADGTYSNTELPSPFFDTAAMALWDDLYINAGTQQGIYYQVDGVAPRRMVTFEFYLSHCCGGEEYYHFLISFNEAFPNSVTYRYLNVSDHGGSATVGVQSRSAGDRAGQYSVNQAIIYPGMQMTWYTTPTAATYYVSNSGDATARVRVDDFAGRTWDEAVGSTKTRMNQWLG